MDEKIWFPPIPGGIWATRVGAEGIWRDIYQDRPLDNPQDAEAILRALGIPASVKNLEHYFPDTKWRKRCPTLKLFELTIVLDPTNPVAKKKRGEVGV